MGINYYHVNKRCEKCGAVGDKKHIGKSSFGWQFHFRGYRDDNIISYIDWIKELQDQKKIILDEDGEEMSLDDFKKMVMDKLDGINHYNVVLNLPMTDKEKSHCAARSNVPVGGLADRTWKDNGGHAFTDWEFS